MIKNTITVSVAFYYKGELFTPSLVLELDIHMQSNGGLPDLYSLIAAANNIDPYSYEYEVMQTGAIKISHADGLISNYIKDGQLDAPAFETAWHESNTLSELQAIAERHLGITDLQANPALKRALLDAYNLDRKN